MVIWCATLGRRALAGAAYHDGQAGRRADLVLTQSTRVPRLPAETAVDSKIFTIFEGTSEIQRLVIGRTITGLPVR